MTLTYYWYYLYHPFAVDDDGGVAVLVVVAPVAVSRTVNASPASCWPRYGDLLQT